MSTETPTAKPRLLIEGWRNAWRLTSVVAAFALTIVSLLQAQVLPLFQFAVPAAWWPWVSAGFGLAIVVLRVLAQPGVLPPTAGTLKSGPDGGAS